jgi:probable F420-dependent oxidoreductase
MKFHVPLVGNHRIPGVPDWQLRLRSPDYQRIAKVIDDLGFDMITTSEHIVAPMDMVVRLGGYWLHAMTVLAFVAGATERVRVDATVLVLPYHHPVMLAKAVSTLDVLSGGRITVSVGVGHAEREFEVLGIPFRERGRITDESLDAMNVLWTSEEPVFHGHYFDFEGIVFEPRPLQAPRPPIWIGGNSMAALRRAARYEGWEPNPLWIAVSELPAHIDRIRSQPGFETKTAEFDVSFSVGGIGRSEMPRLRDASAQALSSLRDHVIEETAALRDIGITVTSVPPPSSSDLEEYLDSLRWVADEVLPVFRN